MPASVVIIKKNLNYSHWLLKDDGSYRFRWSMRLCMERMECSQNSTIISISQWCLISGSLLRNLLSKKNQPPGHPFSLKHTYTHTFMHTNSELKLLLCSRYNSRINVGVTPDVDCCKNKFSYDLFSLFACKHRNSNVETVAERISVFHKIHGITHSREGKDSNM